MNTTADTLTGIKIAENGSVTRVQIDARDNAFLPSMYAHTDCTTVEVLPVIDGSAAVAVDAWMDENGRLNGSQPNVYASMVINVLSGSASADRAALGWAYLGPDQVHFGAIVLLGADPATGESRNLPSPVVDLLLNGGGLHDFAAHAETVLAARA